MVKPVQMLLDEEGLRKALHSKIDELGRDKLSLMNRVLLQLEAEELAETLDGAFDQDRKEGKLSSERVQQILAEVRRERPYH